MNTRMEIHKIRINPSKVTLTTVENGHLVDARASRALRACLMTAPTR